MSRIISGHPPGSGLSNRTAIPVSLLRQLLFSLAFCSAAGSALAETAGRPSIGTAEPSLTARPVDRSPPVPARAGWWSVYRDPELGALIARVHAGNATMAAARARLAMARADAGQAAAERLPSLDLGTSAAHAAGPLINAAGQSGDLYTARAGASWELDLLGRLAANRRAADDDVAAADAVLSDVTLLVEAAAVRAWFTRRSAALAAADASRASAIAADLLAIGEARQKLGLVSPAALDALRERARSAAARARDLALIRDSAARQITYLAAGDGDSGPLPADALPEPPDIPADLPADLLVRRPDLRAAQARVSAADARLSAARRGWLPPITLTATRGQASSSLGQLLASAGGFFGLGAVLALPIFDGGRHKARVARGRSERDLAEAQYRDQAAAALRDVFDSLQAAQTRQAAAIDARDAARASEQAAAVAQARAEHGTISRAEALEAERLALDRKAEASLAQGWALIAAITLQQAVGGGW